MRITNNTAKKGLATVYTLVFGTIFLFVFLSIMNMLLAWHRLSIQSAARELSLHIAEAGIEYYKWHLLHFPEQLIGGPMVYGPFLFRDPEGRVSGQFIVEAASTLRCGQIGVINISSTGWTNQFPEVRRTVQIKHARPSVANFSFIINSDVWVGGDQIIRGPYHSNRGIRMDGDNRSLVTSAIGRWMCTETFGCNPPGTRDGVFTTTSHEGRGPFSFPVPQFDFNGITGDIAAIRSTTLPLPRGGRGLGVYIPPSNSGRGYRVVFSGRSIDVFEITALGQVQAFNHERGTHQERSIITAERFYGRFNLPNDCGAIFIEDNVWIQGTVGGKVTLVAANADPNIQSNIWLRGNIEYSPAGGIDGTDGLIAIAEGDILITPDSPDLMRIKGVFIAQNGRFGRNRYLCSDHPNYCLRSRLEIIGSVISSGRVGTRWINWFGQTISGYGQRETIYDPRQGLDPMPFLPVTSPLFEVVSWKEAR